MTFNKTKNKDEIEEVFISKKEVIDICNRLKNAQDKVLIYGTYSGINGNQLEYLRKMKYSGYDEKKDIIKVEDKEFKIDNYFKKILEECRGEKEYYIYNGKMVQGSKNKFEINDSSEYILRGKPTVVNNNGLDPIGYPSLQNRINTISEMLGKKMTCNRLHRSKVVEEMYLIKKEWKNKEIEEYLKNNNLRFKASNIKSLLKKIKERDNIQEAVGIEVYERIKNIKTDTLTIYQKDVIQALYRVVASFLLVNETQKRKIENEHYRANEYSLEREKSLRDTKEQIIEHDKIYWEFIVNKGFNLQQEDYAVKVYLNKEDYIEQKEIYQIEYNNGCYVVNEIINGEKNKVLFANKDCIAVSGEIIDSINKQKNNNRKKLISETKYTEEEKLLFTPNYINDIGLDMILAIKEVISFEELNNPFKICELLEDIQGIKKVVPCIDASTQGETYIVINTEMGETIHLKVESENKIRLIDSIGVRGRTKLFVNIEETIKHMSKNYIGIKIEEENKSKKVLRSNEIMDLIKKIDVFNEKSDAYGVDDDFTKSKNKEYLHYKVNNEEEVIVSLYSYDLSVTYSENQQAYMVKRYVELSNYTERVYDIYKSRDLDELVKWLSVVKVNEYDQLEYCTF